MEQETNSDILENIILRQIGENHDLNLLYTDLENEVGVNEAFRDYFLSVKQQKDLNLTHLIREAARATVRHFYSINQYIQPSVHDIADLENIYIRTFEDITPDNFTEIMKKHILMIRAWLLRFYSAEFADSLAGNSRIGKVENRDYSAPFQLELFGLDAGTLMEPVLDIGCGQSARLVLHLSELGLDVTGIDRIADPAAANVSETSWFEFSFNPDTWGTIVANMSFTNHLLHCLCNRDNRLQEYFILYKRIIESLKSGGSFHYAPSLEFIEDRLDKNSYHVRRKKVSGIGVTEIVRI